MRFLGWIFLILTIAVVVLDWLARGESGEMILRTLGEVWAGFDPGSLATMRTEAESAAPGVVARVVQPLLDFPLAMTLGIAYLIFRFLSAMFTSRRNFRNYDPV